jgi:hypothetical protein
MQMQPVEGAMHRRRGGETRDAELGGGDQGAVLSSQL